MMGATVYIGIASPLACGALTELHMQAKTAFGFLAVPLRTAPLLVSVTFSFLLFLALKASLLGIPLGLLLLTGLFNYTFVLLDSVINGDAEPPVLSIEMMNPVSAPRSLLLLALVVTVFFASKAAAYWLGAGAALVAAIACATLLPALLAIQAITGSTVQALNVLVALRLIRRIGSDYLTLVIFIVAAVLIGTHVASLTALPMLLRLAALITLWFASFCLIGGVVREHSDDIGLADAWTPEQFESSEDPHEERRRTQLVDQIYAEWRGGAYANAWQTVMTRVGNGPEALSELEWLYEHIARWPDPRLAHRLAREILPRLLAARRNGEAVDMVRARLQADPEFRPESSGDLLHLAGLARDAGDRPTARALLRDFDRLYPGDAAQTAASSLIQQLER